MQKAPESMMAAVKAVHPRERLRAAKVAERAFAAALQNPNFEGNRELAAEYAAAEVAYLFA